jgi:hypothetical protein
MMYKLLNANTEFQCLVLEKADGSVTSIPFDPANTDFIEYQKWLNEGNTPTPADEA